MAEWEDLSLDEKVAQVKASVSPEALVQALDIDGVEGGKIPSPWNLAERTPSCHLYEDHFFDYSSGRGGDVIDLYMALTSKTWGASINRLGRLIQSGDLDETIVKREPDPPADLAVEWRKLSYLTTAAAEKWADVCAPYVQSILSGRDMVRTGDGRLYIAHKHDGVVRGIKIREWSGAKSAVPGSQFHHGLYDPFFSSRCDGTVVITEGESDCWALWHCVEPFVTVMALPSGAGLWRKEWMTQLDRYKTVYTAFDNDYAGKQATDKVARAIGWGRWKGLTVPTLYKDCRAAIAAGWRPEL